MARFRKKPVEIDAIQLTWQAWGDICDFVGQPIHGVYVHPDDNAIWADIPHWGGEARIGLLIKTLEGEMLAVENDWIIKGVRGEFYPCKPDIFAATYEAVA